MKSPDPAKTPFKSIGFFQWVKIILLYPLFLLYRFLDAFRRSLYKFGVITEKAVSAPVISLGNLTVGGSGKTPFTQWILRYAVGMGLRPVSISRGYKSKSGSYLMRLQKGENASPALVGDEPFMLSLNNPTVPVYVGKNRVDAARWAVQKDAPDFIVLDDGFQHLRLKRDLNVLLVDGAEGFGNGWVLPCGTLREPVTSAKRADVAFITKIPPEQGVEWKKWISKKAGGIPVFTADYVPTALRRLDGKKTLSPSAMKGSEVHLLSAIAQPGNFQATVEKMGIKVKSHKIYRDHHHYTPADISEINKILGMEATEMPQWLTTEKDAVKLKKRLSGLERLWILDVTMVPEPEAEAFFKDFFKSYL